MHLTKAIAVIALSWRIITSIGVAAIDPNEALAYYGQNQDRLEGSLIVRFQESNESISQGKSQANRRLWEVRLGEERSCVINNYRRNLADPNIPLDEGAWRDFYLWDGQRGIEYSDSPNRPRARLRHDNMYESYRRDYWPGSPLFGVRTANNDRIDTVLRRCESMSVREEKVKVGSTDCYVIDAKEEYTSYTLYLSPGHGYSIVQADVIIKPGGVYFRDTTLKQGDITIYRLRNVRIEQKGETFVPMEWDLEFIRSIDGWNNTLKIQTTVSEILFDPNHIELKSFVPKVRKGTWVRDESEGDGYYWGAQREDAIPVFRDALNRAKQSQKNVLLIEGAPWCSWCLYLDDYLARATVARILAKDYEIIKLDSSELRNTRSILDPYRQGEAQGGIPWCAFLKADGKCTTRTVGFSVSIVDTLSQARLRITEDELQTLRRELIEMQKSKGIKDGKGICD